MGLGDLGRDFEILLELLDNISSVITAKNLSESFLEIIMIIVDINSLLMC